MLYIKRHTTVDGIKLVTLPVVYMASSYIPRHVTTKLAISLGGLHVSHGHA